MCWDAKLKKLQRAAADETLHADYFGCVISNQDLKQQQACCLGAAGGRNRLFPGLTETCAACLVGNDRSLPSFTLTMARSLLFRFEKLWENEFPYTRSQEPRSSCPGPRESQASPCTRGLVKMQIPGPYPRDPDLAGLWLRPSPPLNST